MAQDIIPAGSTYSMPPGSFYPVQPEEQTQGSRSAKDLFYIMFKWQRLILSIFLVFTVATAIAMLLKPPVHTATAKIMFKKDRTPLQISGASVSKVTFAPQVLQSEVELVQSREVLLPVARKLLTNNKGGKGPTIEEIEATVSSLGRNIVPAVIPNTSIIQLTYYDRTPEEAQKTLSLIVDQYVEQQSLVESGAMKLLEFYQKNTEKAAAGLGQAEEQLRKWEAENGTVSIKEQITGELKMLESREIALEKSKADIEAAQAKVAMLKSQISSQPERVVMSREQVMNPLVTKLKGDLVAAEVALQELFQRYTDKDRRVIEKREQVALLKTELAAAVKEEIVGKETTELNPLNQVIKKDLAATQAYLAALLAERETIQPQVRGFSNRLAALREKQFQVDPLRREANARKDTYLLYAKRLEEAQIRADLGKEQLADVAVIEQPHADIETDARQRVLMVLLAAFVGLTLGAVIAFGIEFLNNSLRTQDDVEHYLGLPVLAAIPDLRSRLVTAGLLSSA